MNDVDCLLVTKHELRHSLIARKQLFLCSPLPLLLSVNEKGLPPQLEEVLEEYKDVFLKELPKSLPALRGIEHHMDLVPGSQLPNRPSYRTTPQETTNCQAST